MKRKAAIRQIQGALLSRGNSQGRVARQLRISEGTVSKVIAGTYPQRTVLSRRMRHAVLLELEKQTGIPLDELQALTAPQTATATAA